ncbi:MAG: OmpH family outer membrane protein [Bacteroidota bacterium]
MKNLSIALNIVLIIAVGFLYYKVYQGDDNSVVITGQAAQSKIVYVNSDSLMNNYPLFQTIKKSMEKKRDSLDLVFRQRGEALQKEIENYQQTGAMLSEADRAKKEEDLTRRQQAYVADRDATLEKLSKEEDTMTDSLHNELMAYVKMFNKKHGYDFIFGYTRGGGIIYTNDSLDITKALISGLKK